MIIREAPIVKKLDGGVAGDAYCQKARLLVRCFSFGINYAVFPVVYLWLQCYCSVQFCILIIHYLVSIIYL